MNPPVKNGRFPSLEILNPKHNRTPITNNNRNNNRINHLNRNRQTNLSHHNPSNPSLDPQLNPDFKASTPTHNAVEVAEASKEVHRGTPTTVVLLQHAV